MARIGLSHKTTQRKISRRCTSCLALKSRSTFATWWRKHPCLETDGQWSTDVASLLTRRFPRTGRKRKRILLRSVRSLLIGSDLYPRHGKSTFVYNTIEALFIDSTGLHTMDKIFMMCLHSVSGLVSIPNIYLLLLYRRRR